HKERLAVAETKRLEIPLVSLVDTNCNPDEIDHPIPANDDAIRAVKLLSSKIADAVLEGKRQREVELEAAAAEKAAAELEAGEMGEEEEEKPMVYTEGETVFSASPDDEETPSAVPLSPAYQGGVPASPAAPAGPAPKPVPAPVGAGTRETIGPAPTATGHAVEPQRSAMAAPEGTRAGFGVRRAEPGPAQAPAASAEPA